MLLRGSEVHRIGTPAVWSKEGVAVGAKASAISAGAVAGTIAGNVADADPEAVADDGASPMRAAEAAGKHVHGAPRGHGHEWGRFDMWTGFVSSADWIASREALVLANKRRQKSLNARRRFRMLPYCFRARACLF